MSVIKINTNHKNNEYDCCFNLILHGFYLSKTTYEGCEFFLRPRLCQNKSTLFISGVNMGLFSILV